METVLAAEPNRQTAWRSVAPFAFLKDVMAVADAAHRAGAVTLASALTRGATAQHGKIAGNRAFQTAVGLIVRDVQPEAHVLYEPWLDVFGWATLAEDETTAADPI